jgi:YihY family inner membrane protein
VRELLRDTLRSFSRHGGRLLAASVAFYAVLSAVPIFTVALHVAGLVTSEGDARRELLEGLSRFLGADGAASLGALLVRADTSGTAHLVSGFELLLLVYASTRLFGSLRQSINHVWDIEPRPSAGLPHLATRQLRRRGAAFVVVLVIGAALVASVAAKTWISAASDVASAAVGSSWPLHLSEWLLSLTVVSVLFAAMFKVLPDARIGWRDVWLGATLTALLFSLGASAIAAYLGRKGLTTVYGPGASVVLLLLWVHYSAHIFFLGVAFTGVWARRRGAGIRPTDDARRLPTAEDAQRRAPQLPSGTPSTHLLVGNPTAQSGKNAERIERALAWLRARGLTCDVLHTLPHGATIEAVREALDGGAHSHVIAMGGDGTFREVAAGLYASRRRDEVALAMLPTGTANDQGRSFGLSADDADLEDNLEVVLDGAETRLDAGKLTFFGDDGAPLATELFFDSAGWGISARVLSVRNEDRRKVETIPGLREVYRDKLVYAGALLRTFLESYVVSDKFTARIEVDGESKVLDGLTDLIVKGTRVYAGAWVFDRTSRHDDGYFEVVPFRGKRDWTSKAIVDLEGNPVSEELLNRIGVEHSKPFRGRHIAMTFEAEGKVPVFAQLDGEETRASRRVEIEVLPKAIRLVVPRRTDTIG